MDARAKELEHKVIERLRHVIDPETGVDVMRMRLIEDLRIDDRTGQASYKFRPSSPLCPMAVHLSLEIRRAVAEVPGISDQEIEVVGYVGAEESNALLKEEG
jgi:metal-sulfur cluster biosynthetic enzyme